MESKKWDWGMMSYSITIENGYLTVKGGGKGANYPVSSVQGVQYDTGLLTATLRVIASGADSEKLVIPKGDKSRKMIEEINAYIAESKRPTAPASTPGISPNLIADELIKLKGLVDAGALTQAEFDAQKVKLLSR
jgi:hypothetical protein